MFVWVKASTLFVSFFRLQSAMHQIHHGFAA